MKSKLMKGLVIVALAGSLTACEMDRQQRHTATGAAIGGVAGGLLGGDIATTLGGTCNTQFGIIFKFCFQKFF